MYSKVLKWIWIELYSYTLMSFSSYFSKTGLVWFWKVAHLSKIWSLTQCVIKEAELRKGGCLQGWHLFEIASFVSSKFPRARSLSSMISLKLHSRTPRSTTTTSSLVLVWPAPLRGRSPCLAPSPVTQMPLPEVDVLARTQRAKVMSSFCC